MTSIAVLAPFRLQARLSVLAAQFARALLRRSTLLIQEGAGKAGCRQAPAVRCAKMHTRKRTAQQHTGGADHSAFPARWSDGLCRDLPGAELSSGLPRRSNWTMPSARLGSRASSIRLDRSNDGQDHTVLPYAHSLVAILSPGLVDVAGRTWRDELNSAARLHAGCRLTGTTRPARPISCRRCRVHRKPGSRSRRPRDRPSW